MARVKTIRDLTRSNATAPSLIDEAKIEARSVCDMASPMKAQHRRRRQMRLVGQERSERPCTLASVGIGRPGEIDESPAVSTRLIADQNIRRSGDIGGRRLVVWYRNVSRIARIIAAGPRQAMMREPIPCVVHEPPANEESAARAFFGVAHCCAMSEGIFASCGRARVHPLEVRVRRDDRIWCTFSSRVFRRAGKVGTTSGRRTAAKDSCSCTTRMHNRLRRRNPRLAQDAFGEGSGHPSAAVVPGIARLDSATTPARPETVDGIVSVEDGTPGPRTSEQRSIVPATAGQPG